MMKLAPIVCLLVATATASADPCAPGSGTTRTTKQIVDDATQPFLKGLGDASLAIVTMRSGDKKSQQWTKGHIPGGIIARPPQPNTLYALGSVTKAFTGLLLAIAETQKTPKIKISDTLVKLLPSPYNNVLPDRTGVRLVDLVTHTSGFAKNSCVNDCPDKRSTTESVTCNFTPEQLWETAAVCPLVASDSGQPTVSPMPANVYLPDQVWTYTNHDDMADVRPFGSRDTEAQPGTQYHYSNTAFALLGRLLEKKLGKPYEKLIGDLITSPIGMTDTVFDQDLSADQRARRANPGGGSPDGNYAFGAWPVGNPAGGLYSTMNDMGLFLEMMVGVRKPPATIGPKALGEALKKWFTGHGSKKGIGFAWEYDSLLNTGCAEYVSKGGDSPGFASWIGFVPSDGNGVVVLTNDTGADAPKAIGLRVLRALHGPIY
jgi:CubicO group peptidase (beta-lactamase class C family)